MRNEAQSQWLIDDRTDMKYRVPHRYAIVQKLA